MMEIVIPTRGRVSNQLTYSNLPPELKKRVIFVCPQNERLWLSERYPQATVRVQPDPMMRISAKRKWIVDQCQEEKIVMLDDDLRFAVRRDDNPGLFRAAEHKDISRAFFEMEEILSEDVPHASFAARGGSIGTLARQGDWQVSGKRAMYVLGFFLPTVRQHAEFGRVLTHEDIDVTLQLLSAGYPNAVNFTVVVDQKLGSPGGCDIERNINESNEDVMRLAELHKEFITVSKKSYKNSPDRLEVVCQWMKCLNAGMAKREDA